MSLINDALIDLEKRREVKVEVSEESSSKAKPQWLYFPVFLLVLGVSSGIAFYLGKYGTDTSLLAQEKIEAADQAQSKPNAMALKERVKQSSGNALNSIGHRENDLSLVDVEQGADAQNPIGDINQDEKELTLKEEASVNALANVESVQVSELLWLAEDAINRNRLTVPVGANALFYLSAIQKIDPDNTVVVSLQNRAREKFLEHIEQAIERREASRVRILMSRLENFDIPKSAVKQYQEMYFSLQQDTQENDKARYAVKSEKQNIAEAGSVSKNDATWVTATFASREQSLLDKAKAYINAGQDEKAEDALNNFLVSFPDSVVVASFSFDRYLAGGQVDKAQTLINNLPEQHAAMAYFNARMSIWANNVGKAVKILEENAPEDAIYLEHKGLLAALYQKMKAYQKAKEEYAQLLTRKPSSEKFLLGFALASDQLGHIDDSQRTYQRLSKLGHSKQSVRDFVSKRLRELNATQSLAEVDAW